MKRRVASRGQVTIPLEIRTPHGFLPGSTVEFREVGGKVLVVKAARTPLNRGHGRAALDALIKARRSWHSPYGSTDDHLDAMRGHRRRARGYE